MEGVVVDNNMFVAAGLQPENRRRAHPRRKSATGACG
jgi:hypothetical protein